MKCPGVCAATAPEIRYQGSENSDAALGLDPYCLRYSPLRPAHGLRLQIWGTQPVRLSGWASAGACGIGRWFGTTCPQLPSTCADWRASGLLLSALCASFRVPRCLARGRFVAVTGYATPKQADRKHTKPRDPRIVFHTASGTLSSLLSGVSYVWGVLARAASVTLFSLLSGVSHAWGFSSLLSGVSYVWGSLLAQRRVRCRPCYQASLAPGGPCSRSVRYAAVPAIRRLSRLGVLACLRLVRCCPCFQASLTSGGVLLAQRLVRCRPGLRAVCPVFGVLHALGLLACAPAFWRLARLGGSAPARLGAVCLRPRRPALCASWGACPVSWRSAPLGVVCLCPRSLTLCVSWGVCPVSWRTARLGAVSLRPPSSGAMRVVGGPAPLLALCSPWGCWPAPPPSGAVRVWGACPVFWRIARLGAVGCASAFWRIARLGGLPRACLSLQALCTSVMHGSGIPAAWRVCCNWRHMLADNVHV